MAQSYGMHLIRTWNKAGGDQICACYETQFMTEDCFPGQRPKKNRSWQFQRKKSPGKRYQLISTAMDNRFTVHLLVRRET
jgi:hypothetical protein